MGIRASQDGWAVREMSDLQGQPGLLRQRHGSAESDNLFARFGPVGFVGDGEVGKHPDYLDYALVLKLHRLLNQ